MTHLHAFQARMLKIPDLKRQSRAHEFLNADTSAVARELELKYKKLSFRYLLSLNLEFCDQ